MTDEQRRTQSVVLYPEYRNASRILQPLQTAWLGHFRYWRKTITGWYWKFSNFDARTGIQRVTRSIAAQLLASLQDMRSGLYMRSSTRLIIYTHMITFCTPLALMTALMLIFPSTGPMMTFYRPRSAAPYTQSPYLRRMHRDGVRLFLSFTILYQFVFPL